MTKNILTKNILLVGMTGNGKSTLANVLTNTDKFNETSDASGTLNIQVETFTANGFDYQIIDTIGIGCSMYTDQEV